jgi:hypothetical protein
MSSELSKVELLAMIKQYNKNNSDKIKNIDKMKKEEIMQICQKYNIIPTNVDNDIKINLSNISKKHLLQDIELFFLKKGQPLPKEINQMKRNQLVEYMEENEIEHYTQSMIIEEIQKYNKQNHDKNVIYYNIMCYDNVNIDEIDNDNLEQFIKNNNLDENIDNLQATSIFLSKIYSSLEEFCKNTNNEYKPHKLKSFPKVIQYIDLLITKKRR